MSEPTPDTVRRAALWHAQLTSGEATEADHRSCERWLSEHPSHAEAFRRLQAVLDRFHGLPPAPARHALQNSAVSGRAMRRRIVAGSVLSALLLIATLGAGSWAWLAADHRSGTGEIAGLSLPDGSRATLGSGSAIDLHYDSKVRNIHLVRGEIMLDVEHDPSRPLTVQTPQGSVRALGTRFTVRQEDSRTWVGVEESRVSACVDAENCITLHAGQAAWLAAGTIEGPFPSPPHAAAWAEGRLVVEDRPLAEVLDHLSRYHRGFLRYDPAELAGITVSGVLPLRDSGKSLAALAASLPIRLRHHSRFWIVVERR
jgi:transmembrane sensor